MNPYQDQVVNQIATLGNRNFNENVMPGLTSQFGGAGQYGSKRMMDFINRGARDSQENILNQQGQLLNTGWNNSNQVYNTHFQQQLTGNQAVNQFGNEQWNRDQQQNQFDLSQWNTQQQAPWQTYGWLSNIVRGLQPGQVGGINYSSPGASQPVSPMLSQMVGGLGQVAQSAVTR
jgi:hypothetical protein